MAHTNTHRTHGNHDLENESPLYTVGWFAKTQNPRYFFSSKRKKSSKRQNCLVCQYRSLTRSLQSTRKRGFRNSTHKHTHDSRTESGQWADTVKRKMAVIVKVRREPLLLEAFGPCLPTSRSAMTESETNNLILQIEALSPTQGRSGLQKEGAGRQRGGPEGGLTGWSSQWEGRKEG